MKVTADTNVLVRAVVNDDPEQGAKAAQLLSEAEVVAVTLPSLCEFVWVLQRVYGLSRPDIISAIRVLVAAENVRVNQQAVEQGLKVYEAGGDFADGVIAYEGQWLGGKTFASFDKRAVRLLEKQGVSVLVL